MNQSHGNEEDHNHSNHHDDDDDDDDGDDDYDAATADLNVVAAKGDADHYDDDPLLSQALPLKNDDDVTNHPEGPERKKLKGGQREEPPRTGQEYLLLVRREARASPMVVVAKNSQALLAPSTAMSSSSPSASSGRHSLLEGLSSPLPSPIPPELQPTGEWISVFLITFASWRLNLERLGPKGNLHKSHGLPKLENEWAWRKFCLGDNSSGQEGTGHHQPTTGLIASFNQRQTLRLLEYHTKWLGMTSISSLQAQWIFSLLLKIDKLLTADATDSLRNLCRKCQQIRQHLVSQGLREMTDPLASLNIFIVIVTSYFQQRDLCQQV